jgi:hypothetical protein
MCYINIHDEVNVKPNVNDRALVLYSPDSHHPNLHQNGENI